MFWLYKSEVYFCVFEGADLFWALLVSYICLFIPKFNYKYKYYIYIKRLISMNLGMNMGLETPQYF